MQPSEVGNFPGIVMRVALAILDRKEKGEEEGSGYWSQVRVCGWRGPPGRGCNLWLGNSAYLWWYPSLPRKGPRVINILPHFSSPPRNPMMKGTH